MKYPPNIFLHNIASWYWQTSTHKVAKIQLLGTKIPYTKSKRIFDVENEVLVRKTVENQRFYGEISSKYIFTQYSIMIWTNFYS